MIVMVVDDSRQIRRHVGRTVVSFGYELMDAEHGKDCLAKVAEKKPDVILLDWNMPEMDGLETLEALKADPATSDITVIMMTTENKEEKIQLAMEKGASEYIMKPLTKDVLKERLESIGDDDFI